MLSFNLRIDLSSKYLNNMKKIFLLSTLFLFAAALNTLSAQGGGGGMRKTLEERVSDAMSKIAEFNLDKSKSESSETIFTDFFKAQDKMREELMAGGSMPDREVMREKNQQMSSERDEKLKKVFSEEQYKKWINDIAPSMMTQRRPQ
jgi:periplasmic protein CpxP/Spy